MIYFNFLMIIGIIVGCLIFRGYRKLFLESISGYRGINKFTYPLGLFIIDRVLRGKTPAVKKTIDCLYPLEDSKKNLTQYYLSKMNVIMLLFLMFNIISLFYAILGLQTGVIKEGGYLERGNYGEGDVTYQLQLDAGDVVQNYDLDVNVSEKRYIGNQLEDLFRQAKEYTDIHLLGKNSSYDNINSSLNFFSSISDLNISVEWGIEDYDYINLSGSIRLENVEEETVVTSVTARFYYYDNEMDYIIPLRIKKPEFSSENVFEDDLRQHLIQADQSALDEAYVKLPEQINGHQIYWKEKHRNTPLKITFLGFLVLIVFYFYRDYQLKERIKGRNQQLLSEYPEIVHKLVLLLNAGMTTRAAWGKITEDYEKAKDKSIKERNYAYEEMIVSQREIENGISESKSYEDFGRRCMLNEYLKLSTLINQCLKKGARGMGTLLTEAAQEAEQARRERAKRLGEEAGTKILIPMMCLLLVVLIIVMFPAFTTMNF